MDARQQMRYELDRMFEEAPRTRAAWELQEELLANCMERYDDLLRDGVPPEEAMQAVLGSIGNVAELVASLPGEGDVSGVAWEAQRRRNSALTVTIAVGLYILAGVVFFLSLFFSATVYQPAMLIGLAIAGAICVVPTCMLVYNAYRWPKYVKRDDTVVENFKTWNHDGKKMKQLRGAISSTLWTLTVVVYLVVSFLTFAWHITWMLFPIAACVECLITLIFRLRDVR